MAGVVVVEGGLVRGMQKVALTCMCKAAVKAAREGQFRYSSPRERHLLRTMASNPPRSRKTLPM
jgi:hypothetical protein